jgi:hypothetical protein
MISRDIRQLKLTNGEEILTEVVGEDREEVLVRGPLKVYRERIELGTIAREANMFTRWMGFCDEDEHIIAKSNILAMALVNDAVAMYYTKMMVNVEQDLITPITDSSEAKVPEVAQAKPSFQILEEDDGTPPTYH